MHRLSWLITLPVILLAVCFAVGNRAPVIVNLWPTGYEVAMPIYLMALLPLGLGLITGGLIIWIGGVRHKLAARRLAREVGKLQDENAGLRRQLEQRQQGQSVDNRPLLQRWVKALPWG